MAKTVRIRNKSLPKQGSQVSPTRTKTADAAFAEPLLTRRVGGTRTNKAVTTALSDSDDFPAASAKKTSPSRRAVAPVKSRTEKTGRVKSMIPDDDSDMMLSADTDAEAEAPRAARPSFGSLPDGEVALPTHYGEDRIVIQVRDPHWLHAYWEITPDRYAAVQRQIGDAIYTAKTVLRVYDISGITFTGDNAKSYMDIEVNRDATSWYLNVGNPGQSTCVEVGLLLSDGRFIMLARSNYVTMPISGPSWITDEEWMVVEEDFNRLYGLSTGLGIGLSSGEITRLMAQRMKRHLASGGMFSPGAFSPGASASMQLRGAAAGSDTGSEKKRNFWLVVNTELIVYGATEPDATVTVQGRPISLNKDGTFSLRFALPDGEQVIPVKAVSADKIDERVITPIVTRRTE